MDKRSFYNLHYIIEAPLKAYLLPKGGTKLDSSVSLKINPPKATYLINKTILFSIYIRYFYGSYPPDIMITHGISFS